MKLLLILCAFSVLAVPGYSASSGAGGAIQQTVDIIRFIKEVTQTILHSWSLIEKLPVAEVTAGAVIYEHQQRLLQQMEAVNGNIRRLEEQQALSTALTIETLLRKTRDQSSLLHRLAQLKSLMKLVDIRYSQLGDYEQHKDTLEPSTLLKFSLWSVDPATDSLSSQLELLVTCLYGDDSLAIDSQNDHSLLSDLTASFEADPEQMCLGRQSPQQFAYHIFSTAAFTELKGYALMEYSYMVLRQLGRGNFTQELQLMREHHQRRLAEAQRVLQQVMSKSGRVYWRCDPGDQKQHVEEKTYSRVTRLLQGFVENEINLNEGQSCWGTCDDYHDTSPKGCYQPENELCGQQPPCKGRLYNCGFVKSDMTICPASNDSVRWYEYISFGDGPTLGEKGDGECRAKAVEASSWSYWLFWRCHYCFCLCDEPGPKSDRYFNLRDSVSDFGRNRIVTGVRFVKHHRVFHLQLQQGELLPRGAINISSLEWQPLKVLNLTDSDLRDGYDYHTLSADSRALDLDEIVGNATHHVVTGVRFRVLNKHLNLEVRFSPFNFSTGLLVEPPTKSYWLGNTNAQRQKLIVKDGGLPTASELPSLPLSKTNQFMEFTSSSREKDAAQNTVPFIDVQEVVPQPPVPLVGLGIYHKGRPGYGGFFAPKVVTFDFSSNLFDSLN
ncbi:hypothetical protein KR059_004149 [Drosophila kikkawai]|nr:hypothetical protein KR059_004149 [Drosophila kikkawai]